MTYYYTPREKAHLAQQQAKAGVLGAIELFMCSDGNYRDADSMFKFEEMKRTLIEQYTPR